MSKKKRKVSIFNKYLLFIFKLFSGIILGLFISLIGQAIIHYGYFSFMFIFLTVFAGFFRVVRKMNFLGILLVDLIFILMIVLLRFYIIFSNNQ